MSPNQRLPEAVSPTRQWVDGEGDVTGAAEHEGVAGAVGSRRGRASGSSPASGPDAVALPVVRDGVAIEGDVVEGRSGLGGGPVAGKLERDG